jgi:hypothetical protein
MFERIKKNRFLRNDKMAYKDPVFPPSTGKLMPLITAAAGLHKKATAAAISSGSAKRPIGISDTN